MVYKKKKGVDPEISKAMGELGRIGGATVTAVKKKAWKLRNTENMGKQPKYSYERKAKATGVIATGERRVYLIPDEVADKPNAYKRRSFQGFWKDKRRYLTVVSVEDGVITVKQSDKTVTGK